MTLAGEQLAPGWDNKTGGTIFQQAYTADKTITPRSRPTTASQARSSACSRRPASRRDGPDHRSGRHAPGHGYVLQGYQCGSVYKPIHLEAQAAVALATYLRAGQTPPAALINGATTDPTNASSTQPAVLLTPYWVNAANMESTVIKDNFISATDLCAAVGADSARRPVSITPSWPDPSCADAHPARPHMVNASLPAARGFDTSSPSQQPATRRNQGGSMDTAPDSEAHGGPDGGIDGSESACRFRAAAPARGFSKRFFTSPGTVSAKPRPAARTSRPPLCRDDGAGRSVLTQSVADVRAGWRGRDLLEGASGPRPHSGSKTQAAGCRSRPSTRTSPCANESLDRRRGTSFPRTRAADPWPARRGPASTHHGGDARRA